MVIHSIGLSKFRNYNNIEVFFHPGINYLIGKNGQGKTNLIESIFFATHLKSFRTPQIKDTRTFNNPVATIHLSLTKRSVRHDVRIMFDKAVKLVMLDERKIGYYSEYIRNFYSILFAPDQLASFKAYPINRRNFIDRALFLIDHDYFPKIREYNRIRKQKGRLLKNRERRQVSVWNQLTATVVPDLIHSRDKLVEAVNKRIGRIFRLLTGRTDNLRFIYKNDFEGKANTTESEIFNFLMSKVETELDSGKILYGPHRDDFYMTLDDHKDKQSFSQGEYRISFLALQLAVNEIIAEQLDFNPILLLDDIASELDEEVINSTIDYISQKKNQVFFTSVKPFDSFSPGNRHRVAQGKVCPFD